MMRITNSMMMNNTKTNINNNKVSVDKLNTQMSTQKKIVKPSDNPLIAIKSLRLSTTLSKINQYYGNNIKDAESWMDVTETALTNMKDIMKDAYRLCVQGATDVLTDEDRSSILAQLKGLSNQVYSEANADYADRTIFTGYKTNSTVAFTDAEEASQSKYEITEQLDATDIQTYNYYANKLETPTAQEVRTAAANGSSDYEATPEEIEQKRLRLSYNSLDHLNSFAYNYSVKTGESTTGNVTITADVNNSEQNFEWRSLRKDSAFTYQADSTGKMTAASLEDLNGYKLTIDTSGNCTVDDDSIQSSVRRTSTNSSDIETTTFKDKDGNVVFTVEKTTDMTASPQVSTRISDSQGNIVELACERVVDPADPSNITESVVSVTDSQGNTINANVSASAANTSDTITITNSTGTVLTAKADTADGYTVDTMDKNLETKLKIKTMSQSQYQEYLDGLTDGSQTADLDGLIFLKDTGEIILGSTLASNLVSEAATLKVNYYKDGFEKGETRPEMYFNCTNMTDISPANHITYTNYDEDNNWIAQNINYTVTNNQDMTINTQIHDVVDADCYRDLSEMTDIVQAAIDAHTTVANLESMLESSDYADEDSQNYLNDCLEKANKQMAYADDHLQKVFGSQITNFENYLSKVNLAITNVGTKGDQLSLAENRMSSQQTTFKELKSSNEDEELSDVTIDYTSAYTAFQASLQAAGKIDDMSLLDYL